MGGVTHCIAPRMGTSKTTIALKLGLELVHPNWLHNSTTHYMRSNPAIYRPAGYSKKRKIEFPEHSEQSLQQKKKKKVRFNQNQNQSKNEKKNIMDSLSELITDFNQNKVLKGKDLKLEEEEDEDIDIKEEEEKKEETTNNKQKIMEVDDDNFDFESIDNDIDNAIK